MSEQYVLQIEWTVPDLPNIVGPFPTRADAKEWALLNIPNGSWNVSPLAYPYYRTEAAR